MRNFTPCLTRPLAVGLGLAAGVAFLLGLLVAIATPAEAALPDLPPRVVAPTDKAEFRHLVLDNGLRVILVSDPKFNRSAASLVVGVGQIDDPRDHPGLAHFTEHMLFLGTEKYPEVAEYGNFITTNGGSSNAYTASDHTNYQFEVRHEAFPEAVDRFAQFFIAPLFSPEYTAREIMAVHNEAMRYIQDDGRRAHAVRRELYDPAAGESIFSTGNKDTLAGATPAIVREFYERTHSADRMALALAGTASLDELERLARGSFAAVPRRDLPPIEREARFLPRRETLRLATIEPLRELRSLLLEFALPPTRPHFAAKSDDLLAALLNYGGPGGLVEALKAADLATGVGAGIWDRTPAYGSLFIGADLTPHGAENIAAVFDHVFAYLAFLREAPFPTAFWHDLARIAALRETYEDRGEGVALVTELANQALFFPLELAERVPHVWAAPDEASYRALLAVLTPDNLLTTFAARGVPTDRTEEIYGVAYGYGEDDEAYARLLNPTPRDFSLPGANPFLPGETRLIAERPHRLIDEPGLSLYYAVDVEFERPQTTLIYRFVPRRALAGPEADVLLRFYSMLVNDALAPAASQANLAGVSYSLNAGLGGLSLTVSGFGDSPARFAQHVAAELLTFAPTEARFASLKEALERGLRSYPQTEAFRQAGDRSGALLREFSYLPDQLIDRAATVTWNEVITFAGEFLAVGRVEALAHGHITPAAAMAAARDFTSALGARPAAAADLLRPRLLTLAPGEVIVDTGRIEGVNSTYRGLYYLPDDAPRTRALATVLQGFVGEPFFTELRTKQQLGYIVGSGASSVQRQHVLLFVVQSSGYDADDLRTRAETFLATLPAELAALESDAFATLVAGARSTWEEKPKSIAEKAGRMFTLAYDYDGEWDRRAETLAALDTLTQEDAVALLAAVLDPAQGRRLIVLLAGENHVASEATPTFTDRDAWKATRHYVE
jgi:insulysin